MRRSERGQKWGTVGVKNSTCVGIYMTKGKRDQIKKLAAKHRMTVSAYVNFVLSVKLFDAGMSDDDTLSTNLLVV